MLGNDAFSNLTQYALLLGHLRAKKLLPAQLLFHASILHLLIQKILLLNFTSKI